MLVGRNGGARDAADAEACWGLRLVRRARSVHLQLRGPNDRNPIGVSSVCGWDVHLIIEYVARTYEQRLSLGGKLEKGVLKVGIGNEHPRRADLVHDGRVIGNRVQNLDLAVGLEHEHIVEPWRHGESHLDVTCGLFLGHVADLARSFRNDVLDVHVDAGDGLEMIDIGLVVCGKGDDANGLPLSGQVPGTADVLAAGGQGVSIPVVGIEVVGGALEPTRTCWLASSCGMLG